MFFPFLEVMKYFTFTIQLSMKFILLINGKKDSSEIDTYKTLKDTCSTIEKN